MVAWMTTKEIAKSCKQFMCDEKSTTAGMLTLLSNRGCTISHLKKTQSGLMEWFARTNHIVFKALITGSMEMYADVVIDYTESCLREHGFVAVSLRTMKDGVRYDSWLHHSFVLIVPCGHLCDSSEACLTVDAYAGATPSRARMWRDWRPELRKLVGFVNPGKEREKLWMKVFDIPADKARFVVDGAKKPGVKVRVFY